MQDFTDTILAEKIKYGCEKSFKKFYDRYHVQLYYIAKQYVKVPALAEDAVQDVFVKFWMYRHKIDSTKSVKSFIFVMLKNHLLNQLRKNREEIISFESVNENSLPRRNVTEDQVIYNEYEEAVSRGLDELSERKREVFELKTYKGHSNSEIAELLDINIRTVKTHYYTSTRFLKTYLKNHTGIITVIASFLVSLFVIV